MSRSQLPSEDSADETLSPESLGGADEQVLSLPPSRNQISHLHCEQTWMVN